MTFGKANLSWARHCMHALLIKLRADQHSTEILCAEVRGEVSPRRYKSLVTCPKYSDISDLTL